MNKHGLKLKIHSSLACAAAAVTLLASAPFSAAQEIGARPLTHQEIKDYNLPEGTNPSGGLMVVGLGEPVYLEVLVDKGEFVSNVTWSVEGITAIFKDPPVSSATFEPSPIPADMPIYSPGDRAIYDAYGRTLFRPDVEGTYTIKAVANTASGTVEMEAKITGARYVGVGYMAGATYDPEIGALTGGAEAEWPAQCGLCHEERAMEYLKTGHASFFTLAVDGQMSSHYNEGCIDCHVLGGSNPMAEGNGSFFDVARQTGWTFPEHPEPGTWAAMPPELQAKANIQCESCHGAGSQHIGLKDNIAVSLSSGDCGQCHDEAPYHQINIQWNLSGHAVATRYPTGSESRLSCVRCHSGIGFIESVDEDYANVDQNSFEYEAIVCAACHDPHNASNPHQLRTVADITLQNGHVVTEGGNGKLCMNCHQARRDAYPYVGDEPSTISTHFGPHYGIQGDLLNGTNAIDYGKVPSNPSAHLYATSDSCASCHMQSPMGTGENIGGGHTFKMHAGEADMVGACADCHGPMDSFDDMKLVDYNYDGMIEGVQTEVEHLMEALAMKLPPVGEPTVQIERNAVYSVAVKRAMYNYFCAEEDGSHGMHNPRYITGILRASITDVGDPFNSLFAGTNIPAGGAWFYSPWFDFYAPNLNTAGWIYHFEHGHLFVSGDINKIFLYDQRQAKWLYTTPELYPALLDVNTSTWFYYSGKWKGLRYFYNYSSGEWVSVN